jgi:hypothetical protein
VLLLLVLLLLPPHCWQASAVAFRKKSAALMTLLLRRSDFDAPVETLRRALHWALEVKVATCRVRVRACARA